MKTRLIYLFSITASLFLASCSEDDDSVVDAQSPEVNMIEPHAEEEIAPGGEVHFEAVFTDNEELDSYKIDIHSNFDGHDHASLKQSEDNPWSYSEVFQIEPGQTSFEALHHIDVPETMGGMAISEGVYDVGVFVTDAAGNESQAFLEVHIEGDHDEDHDDHDHED